MLQSKALNTMWEPGENNSVDKTRSHIIVISIVVKTKLYKNMVAPGFL